MAQDVWKAFGETQALRDVSLDVGAGECHGLVGRNGAGKSTLVAIFTGLIRPDRGTVSLGTESAPSMADRATWQRLVACVYQKSMMVPSLTVAENVFLNRATGNDHGIINWRAMRSRARQVMLDWCFDLDVDRLARDLTIEQRQVVGEIKQDHLVKAMVGVAPQRATEIPAPMRVLASARPRLEISRLHVPT